MAPTVHRQHQGGITIHGLVFLCVSVGLAGFGRAGAAIGAVRLRSIIAPAFSVGSWVALAGLLSGNAIFHAVGTVRSRRYSPGLVTGVLVYLPLTTFGAWYFVHAGRLSIPTASAWLVVGASYQLWATIGHRFRA